jgi:glycosyltransferase involved in cell wall biosynthesis
MLTVITCTRNRPVAFALLRRWIEAQDYAEPYQWLVVCDGGAETYDFGSQCMVIRRDGRGDAMHSYNSNLLAAVPHVRGDMIAILEDDDYYLPRYLSRLTQELARVDLAGMRPARHYNIGRRDWRMGANTRHASLGATAFRDSVLPLFLAVVRRGNPGIDIRLWNEWRGTKSIFEDALYVGIKGMPGENGITREHRESNICHPDPDLAQFRAWAIPSVYLDLTQVPTADPTWERGERRVTYVTSRLQVCGGIKIIYEHLNRLCSRGHDGVLLTIHESPIPHGWMPAIFPIVHADRSRPAWLDTDIVVATDWASAAFVHETRWANRDAELRYFVQMQEDLFRSSESSGAGARQTYKLPLAPITISRWLKAMLETEYGHTDVPVIPNGIDTEVFYPDPYRLPRVPGKYRIVIEGHEGNAAKNLRDSFAVVDELRRRGLTIEVYGFSQQPPRYPYDRFWRLPDFATIRHIYSSGDLFLKTTRYEGRPAPHVEAMACGVPVVTTDMRATEDCEDGRAIIKPYGDIRGLSEACEWLLLNPGAARVQADRALAYVMRTLRWPRVIDDLEGLLGLVA